MYEQLFLEMKIVTFLYFLAHVIGLTISNFKADVIYIGDLFKCGKLL